MSSNFGFKNLFTHLKFNVCGHKLTKKIRGGMLQCFFIDFYSIVTYFYGNVIYEELIIKIIIIKIQEVNKSIKNGLKNCNKNQSPYNREGIDIFRQTRLLPQNLKMPPRDE